MYLFDKCPFIEKSPEGSFLCFDTEYVNLTKRHSDTIQDFCSKDFRLCPYYQINGTRGQFPPVRMIGRKAIR